MTQDLCQARLYAFERVGGESATLQGSKCLEPGGNAPSVNFVQIEKYWAELSTSVKENEFVQIPMTGHWSQNGEYFIADRKYKDVLNQRSWLYKNNKKPVMSFGGKCITAHWFILRVLEQRRKTDKYHNTIDHRNIKPLDDTVRNLRYSTKATQASNRAVPANNNSGAKGVQEVKTGIGGWYAKITFNIITIQLGTFRIFEIAVYFYDITVDQWVGDSGKPNYVLRGDKYAWKFGDKCLTVASLLDLQRHVSKPKNIVRFKLITGLQARIAKDLKELNAFISRQKNPTAVTSATIQSEYINHSSTVSVEENESASSLHKPTALMTKEEIDELIREAMEQDALDANNESDDDNSDEESEIDEEETVPEPVKQVKKKRKREEIAEVTKEMKKTTNKKSRIESSSTGRTITQSTNKTTAGSKSSIKHK